MGYKLVAYSMKDGTCDALFICKNVDEQEFNHLLNQYNANRRKQADEKNALELKIKKNEEEILNLKNQIKFLKGEQ